MSECGLKHYEIIENFPKETVEKEEYKNYDKYMRIFEKIALVDKDSTNMKVIRCYLPMPYAYVKYIGTDIKTNQDTCFIDIEQDLTENGIFDCHGNFCCDELTIPAEKGKCFNMGLPYFYIKYSKDAKYCYVLDTYVVKNKLRESHPRKRKLGVRDVFVLNRKYIFEDNDFAICCSIQDWLKTVKKLINKYHVSRFE